MLGLAVGDALGNPAEGMSRRRRRSFFGEIRDYVERGPHGEPIGLPSDDTQLAFWTLDQINRDDGLVPDHLAERFFSRRIFGIGRTVRRARHNHNELHLPWHRCGVRSAGNGALMRIAPILIPYLRRGGNYLWADTVLASIVTHNEPGSIAACVAFVQLLWDLLAETATPDPMWILKSFVSTAEAVPSAVRYRPRCPAYQDTEGAMFEFTRDVVEDAWGRGLDAGDACDQWYSGAYLLETIPSALYILMRHLGSFEDAVVRAVNDTWDNDTIGAIVGAAAGALHGVGGIPERWISGLLGRTEEDDDGRVFEILADARQLWWERPAGVAWSGPATDREST